MNDVVSTTCTEDDKGSTQGHCGCEEWDEESIVYILLNVSKDPDSSQTAHVDAPVICVEELVHCILSASPDLLSAKWRDVGSQETDSHPHQD